MSDCGLENLSLKSSDLRTFSSLSEICTPVEEKDMWSCVALSPEEVRPTCLKSRMERRDSFGVDVGDKPETRLELSFRDKWLRLLPGVDGGVGVVERLSRSSMCRRCRKVGEAVAAASSSRLTTSMPGDICSWATAASWGHDRNLQGEKQVNQSGGYSCRRPKFYI